MNSTMSEIGSKHADLINGLQEIYNTLAELQYINTDDIIQPPYRGHNLPASTLQAFSYDDETVALIRCLPWLSDELICSTTSSR